MSSAQTSLISILSCEHGRLRREQRDISKRDLQRALKHGSFERAWNGRCKVTYEGIIFITDESRRREITAYPAPLAPVDLVLSDRVAHDKAKAPVDLVLSDRVAHDKAKRVIAMKPELCASHTVLVVDNSGSMTTHDILLHRDRQVAAYTTTALEFIAEQLLTGTANNSDVVSLVEFSRTATTVFTREPVSWVLFNKLLARRDTKRKFVERQISRENDAINCDSNYLPALRTAQELLAEDTHDHCALSLLFLSDGAPSDARALKITPTAAEQRMSKVMADIAVRFGDRLNILALGFGNEYHDFSTLRSMVLEANKAAGREAAKFMYCDKMASVMGTSITSLVQTSVATRISLNAAKASGGKTARSVESEKASGLSHDWHYYRIVAHEVFDPRSNGWVSLNGLPPGALREDNVTEAVARSKSPPPLLALNKKCCGSGVERLAFRCYLADGERKSDFNFGAMVAKETKMVERIEENIAFHKDFCMTQDLAAHLALEFNKRLAATPGYDETATPRIEFLRCSVLVLEDFDWPESRRGVLVEKMLDTDRFRWSKWNNNAGAVNGVMEHLPIDVDRELKRIEVGDLDAVVEGDSDDEDEDSEDTESLQGEVVDQGHPWISMSSCFQSGSVTPFDYVQAFTHFSYLYTNRQVMVCDLQGVFNTDEVPPTFELSDPAIHYASKTGREMVFGRTDLGKRGMELFFKTHKCSAVCKVMNLSQRNKEWKKQWRNRKSRK